MAARSESGCRFPVDMQAEPVSGAIGFGAFAGRFADRSPDFNSTSSISHGQPSANKNEQLCMQWISGRSGRAVRQRPAVELQPYLTRVRSSVLDVYAQDWFSGLAIPAWQSGWLEKVAQ